MRAAVEKALQDATGEAPDLWGDGAPASQEPLPPMRDLPHVYDLADEVVRRAIVERLLASARSEALDCSADLRDRSQAYAQAEADAQAARAAIARTQETLAATRAELEQAEARVAGVEEEYRDVIELASSTEQVAQGAAERAELADDELRRVLDLVAAARADAEAARGEAVRTRSAADAALTRMEETAGPALATARQAAQGRSPRRSWTCAVPRSARPRPPSTSSGCTASSRPRRPRRSVPRRSSRRSTPRDTDEVIGCSGRALVTTTGCLSRALEQTPARLCTYSIPRPRVRRISATLGR